MENSEQTVEQKSTFDMENLVPPEETLQDILSAKVRVGWKPDVSHLEEAVVDGKFMVPVGGKLLIEYTQTPWRDTSVFIVSAVEPGGLTPPGYVRLWDPNRFHYSTTNFLSGPAEGLILKIPDSKRKWVPGEEETVHDLVKRRRLRGAKEVAPVEKPVQLDESGNPIVRKRGRPKGSKNKSTLLKEGAK